MKITLNIKLALLSFLLIGLAACNEFRDSTDYTVDEFRKDLDGSWSISQVSRNGNDITSSMDFSAFRISFNSDKTYTIENYLPFLVRNNGTWSIDNPQYPTLLILQEQGEQQSNSSAFKYNIVNGERQMVLSFSPGCHSNVYTYVLERVSNN